MPYSVKIALQSLLHERWINLLSMITIAMGLMVMTLVALCIYNVDLFTKRLPEKFSVVAYLKEGIIEADLQNILASLKKNKDVEKVRYISKTEAFQELRNTMRDADYILEGLNENPLSASIEIRLKREAVTPESVISFVSDIKKMTGVDECGPLASPSRRS
ncbi:MAG: permease-like cell division protein FtsX [Thermodesulfovibrionales bacterium]